MPTADATSTSDDRRARGPGAARRRRRSRKPGSAPISSRSCSSRRCTPARRPACTVADRMRLPYAILEPLVEAIRARAADRSARHARAPGTAGYRYALTDLGRDRARQYLDVNQYVGPGAGAARRLRQRDESAGRGARLHRPRAASRAASRISSSTTTMLEQLGPAVNAGKAHVPLRAARERQDGDRAKAWAARSAATCTCRTRSTSTARPSRCSIRSIHESLDERRGGDRRASSTSAPRDRRWVRIRRPVVIVGGELTLDMLDLTFNPISKFHEAPLQLKANGGVFLVDDFGRQRMRPEDLLNRWIVPLESRVDYLTLHTGKKIPDAVRRADRRLRRTSIRCRSPTKRSCAAFPTRSPIEDPTRRAVHADLRAELHAGATCASTR